MPHASPVWFEALYRLRLLNRKGARHCAQFHRPDRCRPEWFVLDWQFIASETIFFRYDLAPVAGFVAENRDSDLAFAGRYQGELTFLARLEKPFVIVELSKLDDWLSERPAGYLVARSTRYPDNTRSVAYSQPMRNGYLLVLDGSQTAEATLR
jgi:hypothetical protein